jgi:hypothetical protein
MTALTQKQRNNFLPITDPKDVTVTPEAIRLPSNPLMPHWTPSTSVSENLRPEVWTQDRVKLAEQNLHASLGIGSLIPPNKVELQNRLNTWWATTGQHLPRNVLDELGVAGGEKVPTVEELDRLERKRQVDVVKDFLGVKPDPQQSDPLAHDTIADPKDITIGKEVADVKPEMAEIIQNASVDDLTKIREVLIENVLDFDDKTFRAVDDEIRIRKAIDEIIIPEIRERPLMILQGTQFLNRLGFGLPEFLSRKGINPLDPKGEATIILRAAGRVRSQIAQQDPRLLTQIGLASGDIVATLIQFAALPDPSKAKVFAKLPKAVKTAIGVGTKAGLLEAMQAPEVGETFEDRAKEIALVTGVGALTGAALQTLFTGAEKLFQTIKDLPVSQQADKILFANPSLKMNKKEVVSILKHLKSSDPEQFKKSIAFRPVKPVVSRAVSPRKLLPTGFRAGMAEIEKPAKLVGKAAKAIGKKEALAITAAKVLPKKAPPVKPVKPTKVLTKKEALSLQESNLVTGEDVDIRIVPSAQMRRSIQTDEKKIAALKTKLAQEKADKKVELARATKIEIAKKEEALVKLREKHGIKIESTLEGMKDKIAKINEATAYKQKLRDDAVSMISAIPKELRADFLKRANKIGTAKQRPETALKKLRKLTEEVEKGVEKLERKLAVGELKSTINKVESENRLGSVRLGKIPSPQREKLIEIIDEISIKKISTQLEPPPTEVKTFGQLDVKARRGREQLLGADLQSLQKVTQRLSSELAGGLQALDANVEEALKLPNERVRQLNLLTQKNVDEIDVDDIKLITDSLQSLVGQAKLKSQLITRQGLKPLDKAVPKAIEEIHPTKRAKKKPAEIVPTTRTSIQKTFDFVKGVAKMDDAHLDTLVEFSTDPKKRDIVTKILDTDLHEGMRKTSEIQARWIEQTAEKFKSIGLTDTKQFDEEFEVILAGQKVKVTADELVSLEMDSRSPENLKARLLSRGIHIGEKTLYYPEAPHEVDRLKEFRDALSNIRDNSALMGFADWIGELNKQQAEAINEVFLLEQGYERARIQNYYPRSRVLPKGVEGGVTDISVPPTERGRYLPRLGGDAPLRLQRASSVFLDGLETDAFTYGMSLPLRNARLLVSNEAFQKAMLEAGRKQELDRIITILRRTQGIKSSRSNLDVFGSRIQRGVVSSALGLRVSTIGTQAMSQPAAFAEIRPRYWRPITPVGKETIARIEEVGTSASADAFSLLLFGKTPRITNKALKGMVWGDKQAIGNIYKHGVLGEVLHTKRNGLNVDPFTWDGRNVADLPPISDLDSKVARFVSARRLEFVVRRTQPMYDMLDRSVSLSSKNVLARSFFIFRTALEAQENIAMRAVDTYSKSPKKLADKRELTEDLGAVITSAFSVAVWKRGLKWAIGTGATAALAAFGVFKFKDPEEKNLYQTLRDDTAKNVVRMNKFGKFAVDIGERIAAAVTEGYNWNRNSFENPILDVLGTGTEAIVSISQVISDAGLHDEFVTEVTSRADEEWNEETADRIAKHIRNALESSFDFGARITGTPIVAPVQEFVRPLIRDSKIPLLNEVTFGDVESPQQFSERVFALYEKRKELDKDSKKRRLTSEEERTLDRLNRFVEAANKTNNVVRELSEPNQRRLRFRMFELKIRMTEENIKQQE